MFMNGNCQGIFDRQGCSPTNLNEGLGPDPRAHFENGGGSFLQQTHAALKCPALHIRARLWKQRVLGMS